MLLIATDVLLFTLRNKTINYDIPAETANCFLICLYEKRTSAAFVLKVTSHSTTLTKQINVPQYKLRESVRK